MAIRKSVENPLNSFIKKDGIKQQGNIKVRLRMAQVTN